MVKIIIKKILKITGLLKSFENYILAKNEYFFIKKINEIDKKQNLINWENAKLNNTYKLVKYITNSTKVICYLDSRLSELIYLNDFEAKEIGFIKSFLKLGDIFIDVGANTGLYTVLASELIGKSGKVYSFEPASKTYKRLLENIEFNNCDNVEVNQLGISDEKTVLSLNLSDDNYFEAWNSFGKPSRGDNFLNEEVKVTTLDEYFNGILSENNLQITLVKIDVEGWEKKVVLGFKNLLLKDIPIVLLVEFTEENAKNCNSSTEELYRLLEEYGFKWYKFQNNSIIDEPFSGPYVYSNLIAAKNISVFKKRGFAI